MIEQLCNKLGYDMDRVRSYNKPTELAIFRGCLYAFLKYETDLSTTQIGKLLNRNHSNIVNTGNAYYYHVHSGKAINKASYLTEKNDYIVDTYEKIKALAGGTPQYGGIVLSRPQLQDG